MLLGLFERTMKRRGVRETDPFDWEKNTSESAAATPATTNGGGVGGATKDANNDNQENLEPDNRLELRISELDLGGKKQPPPRPHRAIEIQSSGLLAPDLSPRKSETTPAVATGTIDRNANKSSSHLAGSHPKHSDVDQEGDAVMADKEVGGPSTVGKKETRHVSGGTKEGDDGHAVDEPPSPSPRIVPNDNVVTPAREAGSNSSTPLVFGGMRGGTMERQRRRMQMPSSSSRTTSFKFRSSGMSSSTLGAGGGVGTGDNSITQMAMMDDDNLSAAITHGGGGGMTLHSRWKSQFDDSEGSENETEMKGEQLQSPEHKQEAGGDDGQGGELGAGTHGGQSHQAHKAESKRSPMPKDKPPSLNLTPASMASGMPPQSTGGPMSPATAANKSGMRPQYPPPPSLAPPPPPPGCSTDLMPTSLQHSASAPSMNKPFTTSTTATTTTPTTTTKPPGFAPPPPPQFAPPPPPATASLNVTYSSVAAATAAAGTTTSTASAASAAAVMAQSSQSSSNQLQQPQKQQSAKKQFLQDHQRPFQLGPGLEAQEIAAAASEGPDLKTGRDVPVISDDVEEDQDEDEEGEEEEEEEEEEYVAAVCHYTTILKDAPPGFDNDEYEVYYHNLNNDTTDEAEAEAAANDHTSPGQNWSSPQINRHSNHFVFAQKTAGGGGGILRASTKISADEKPKSSSGMHRGHHSKASSETDSKRLQPARSSSSERLIDTNYTQSTQDESASDVPQAIYIRPPARMRIFQTEVEDDDEDGEGDEGEDEDGGSGKEEEPPIPPPRSKSKESSLSSRGGGGALRSKEDVTEGGMGGGLGPAASRSPNDRSVYFDAVQCNNDLSSVTSGGGAVPPRRTTPAGQDRSLGSFRESQNVESVEKKEIMKLSEVTSSGGDSCSRSCSDHSAGGGGKQHLNSTGSGQRPRSHRTSQGRSSKQSSRCEASAGGSSSLGGGHHHHHQSARRISLDDLSSAFQALISNSSAAVAAAATMSKKNSAAAATSTNSKANRQQKSLMNRSLIAASVTSSDCCQSDNSGLGDHTRSSPAASVDRMRSRSEENLLDNRSIGSHSSHRMEDAVSRGVSYSPVSLKQSTSSIRSNDSSMGAGRFNVGSRQVNLTF